MRTGGSYGLNFIDSTRTVSFPGYSDKLTADYQAGTGQLFGEVGYSVETQAMSLEPFAGFAWVHLDTDGFHEKGGAAALKGSSQTSDVGYATLGIRAATDIAMANGSVLTPRVSVAWQNAFGDLTPTAALAFASMPGTSFSVAGVPLAQNAALIDAGFDLTIGANARIGLSYLGQIASSYSNNTVWGSFTWSF